MKGKYLFLLLTILAVFLSACGAEKEKETITQCREEKEEFSPEEVPAAYHKNGKCFSYSVSRDGRVYLMYSPEKEEDYYSAALYSPTENNYSLLPFLALEEDMGFVEIMEAPDGTVMLLTTTTAYLHHPGEMEYYAKMAVWPAGGIWFPEESVVVCQAFDGSPYYKIDLTTGKKIEICLDTDFLEEKGSGSPFLYERDGRVYLTTPSGLYEKTEESWELRVAAEKTSLSKPGFHPEEIGQLEDGRYYACDRNYRYIYSPMTAEEIGEQTVLRVTAWQDRFTLKSALVEYQIAHPEITIEYDFQCVDEPKTPQEANPLLQKLNLEIMSEDTADIYILDNLPWESYQDKGYLMDLTEAVEPYAKEDAYFKNILTAYESENGLFAVPWFFNSQMVVCRKEAAPFVKDIHSLAAYLQNNPEEEGPVPYYLKGQPELFLQLMYEFYGADLRENGAYTPESVERFFESAGVIYERIMENAEVKTAGGNASYFNLKYSTLEQLYLLWEEAEGSMAFAFNTPHGAEDAAQTFFHPDYVAVPVGGIKGEFLMGIHEGSQEKEEAVKLLQFLLEYFENYGEEDNSLSMFAFLPGIPVGKQPLLNWMNRFSEAEDGGKYFVFGMEYPLQMLTEKEQKGFLELFEDFSGYALETDVISNAEYSVFIERGQGFLTGEKSLEKTVEEVYSGLKLIYDEKH